MTKITPEIKKFIESNCTLSDTALSGLIDQKFGVRVTPRTIDPYLAKARAETLANNNAKIEAVRSQILDGADQWAKKYLRYLDEEVESLKRIIDAASDIEIETAKDRATMSQAFQKSLSVVLDFVKPETEIKIDINQDLSKLSEEELEAYGRLASKLGSISDGEGAPPSS